MQIDSEAQQRMERLFSTADENRDKLNEWEISFIESNHEGFINDKGGMQQQVDGYFVTPKMWDVIAKIEEKLGLGSMIFDPHYDLRD